jgi:hypothetical protein
MDTIKESAKIKTTTYFVVTVGASVVLLILLIYFLFLASPPTLPPVTEARVSFQKWNPGGRLERVGQAEVWIYQWQDAYGRVYRTYRADLEDGSYHWITEKIGEQE